MSNLQILVLIIAIGLFLSGSLSNFETIRRYLRARRDSKLIAQISKR